MTLVLVGHRGVGKTTLGRAASRILGRLFRDSDEELVCAHGCATPADLGRAIGEKAFREAEAAWLSAALQPGAPAALIALGAGAIEHPAVQQELGRCESLALWLPEALQKQRWVQKGIPWASESVLPAGFSSPEQLWERRLVHRTEVYQRCARHQVLLQGELEHDLEILLERVRRSSTSSGRKPDGV